MNIQIKLNGGVLSFSKYSKKIDNVDLNNTNVINDKCMVFSREYIESNYDIITAFFNLIMIKNKIDSATIKSNDIAIPSLSIIKSISSIINIKFIENEQLNYTISSMLLENSNIKSIECYSMPEIMYYKFDKDIVKTRCQILFKSDFMNYNDINTYSDLYNKDKIVIDSYLTTHDVDDIIFFFKTNKNIKKVIIRGYTKSNLITFVKIIKENCNDRVSIILIQDDNNIKELMKDVKFFDKLSKDNNINIKIKYTKKYIGKNKIKELDLKLIKYSILVILITSILLFLGYKFLIIKGSNDVNKINKKLNQIISENEVKETFQETNEEVPSEYISSYYKSYNNVYSELLQINSDTIGWLKINNTKVNYPVVQYSDNEYYLNHAYDKSNNIIGWIFADYRNNFDFLDKNTIIYGHSMVDGGLMFTTLTNLLNEYWYNNLKNLNIEFSVKEKKYTWSIFSIYVIENTNDYLYTNFESDNAFMEFIDMVRSRSINDFDQKISIKDRILTLSTCYKDDNHRLVVHAVLK